MMSTFVVLIFIGVVIGWIYKGLVGEAGPRMTICMAFAIIGAIAGGLIFIIADLGGELVVGLLTSIVVVMAADVLSRELSHE